MIDLMDDSSMQYNSPLPMMNDHSNPLTSIFSFFPLQIVEPDGVTARYFFVKTEEMFSWYGYYYLILQKNFNNENTRKIFKNSFWRSDVYASNPFLWNFFLWRG